MTIKKKLLEVMFVIDMRCNILSHHEVYNSY